MKKRMSKKGAIAWDQMLYILLGLSVLVLVILYILGFFDIASDPFKNPDFDRVLLENTCVSYLNLGGSVYCSGSYEIADNAYINCPYAVTNYGIVVEGSNGITCTGVPEKNICSKLKDQLGDKYDPEKIKVNGKSCKDFGVPKEG